MSISYIIYIVLGVVGLVAIVAAIVILSIYSIKRRKRRQAEKLECLGITYNPRVFSRGNLDSHSNSTPQLNLSMKKSPTSHMPSMLLLRHEMSLGSTVRSTSLDIPRILHISAPHSNSFCLAGHLGLQIMPGITPSLSTYQHGAGQDTSFVFGNNKHHDMAGFQEIDLADRMTTEDLENTRVGSIARMELANTEHICYLRQESTDLIIVLAV